MRKSKISISGFKIGTAENREGLTGVTVILAPDGGATAGVDVRGCAPGTRETDLLDPRKTVQKIHAVVLSGGICVRLGSRIRMCEIPGGTGGGIPDRECMCPDCMQCSAFRSDDWR